MGRAEEKKGCVRMKRGRNEVKKGGKKKTLLIDPTRSGLFRPAGEDGKILFVLPENKKYTTFSPAAKTKSGWLLRTEKTGLSKRIYSIVNLQ